MKESIRASLIYDPTDLEKYFEHGKAKDWTKGVETSVDAVNRFGAQYSWSDLANRKEPLPSGYARSLQYYKDETLLTLYAFASLDLLGEPDREAERKKQLDALMKRAFGDDWDGFKCPRIQLETQIPAPRSYQEFQRKSDTGPYSHPVKYVRAIAKKGGPIEGATHVDALIEDEDRKVLFEAKFLSDISDQTTYDIQRNQIARNLDVGLSAVNGNTANLYFILITPKLFRENPGSRLYGYKLPEYKEDPSAIQRDLPHLPPETDFAELARHIGWVTWEEIWGILQASEAFRDPEGQIEAFFAERRVLPPV